MPELPDLVFTANAAVVLNGVVLLARFRHAERAGEEPYFETAFRKLQACGFVNAICKLPDGIVLEGAGDCVWDATRSLFWMGYGPRSDAAARDPVAETFDTDVVALELVDPRFYHMDTALVPLSGGDVMYVPEAFSAGGLAVNNVRATGLVINAGAVAVLANGTNSGTSKVSSLSITTAAGGKLDLSDNKLIITSGTLGTFSAGSYSGITGLIASGRHGGDWQGSGIYTSKSNAAASGQPASATDGLCNPSRDAATRLGRRDDAVRR